MFFSLSTAECRADECHLYPCVVEHCCCCFSLSNLSIQCTFYRIVDNKQKLVELERLNDANFFKFFFESELWEARFELIKQMLPYQLFCLTIWWIITNTDSFHSWITATVINHTHGTKRLTYNYRSDIFIIYSKTAFNTKKKKYAHSTHLGSGCSMLVICFQLEILVLIEFHFQFSSVHKWIHIWCSLQFNWNSIFIAFESTKHSSEISFHGINEIRYVLNGVYFVFVQNSLTIFYVVRSLPPSHASEASFT